MISIIDTHTHGYFSAFDAMRTEMISRAKTVGVIKQIQIGCDEISSRAALELAAANEGFFSSVGVHPTDVKKIGKKPEFFIWGWEDFEPKAKNLNELMEIFSGLIANNPHKIKAIGETGLDFFHDKYRETEKEQFGALEAQLFLAQKHSLPLVIHMRDATEDMLSFFEMHKSALQKVGGVIHCFSETIDVAKEFTEKYGFLLGIGGLVTYPHMKYLQEAVRDIPIEFLVTETDAPFLSPTQWKTANDINEPASLLEVVETIAELKNMEIQICAQKMVENAERVFKL
jgi:TatD DNase family protein